MTLLRRVLSLVVLGAATWALLVLVTGGFVLSVAGVRIASRAPERPLTVALCALLVWAAVARPTGWLSDLATVGRSLSRTFTASRLATLLVCTSILVSLQWNAWTAGGADAYAYVTQANLWLHHGLIVHMPFTGEAPWPDVIATLTPYGYVPTPDRQAIVPMTAPGLPLLMAAFQGVAGYCAGFFVTPLAGGLLVWVTYRVARAVGDHWIGVGAAWLMATSPTFLSMAKSVMSDVPAAACWGLALAGALQRSRAGATVAGASAAAAILVRPNLAPLAGILGLWLAWRDLTVAPRHPARVALFLCATLPGPLAIAWFHHQLYGSPLASGYGSLDQLFSLNHVATNLTRYVAWTADTQTPLAVVGALALFLPVRRLWPTTEARHGALLLGSVLTAVLAAYLAYYPFDAWWFLRFLLPGWMALCIGTATLVVRGVGTTSTWRKVVSAGVLIGVGTYTAAQARTLGVFPVGEGERRYATIAELVAGTTEASSVIIAGQHVGATRFYADRLTLQFAALDEAWLDRTVAWLHQRDRPVYFLLEDWEVPLFKKRFRSQNVLGELALSPVLAYTAHRIPGTVYLFDPDRPDPPTRYPPAVVDPRPLCPRPPRERNAPPA